MEGKIISMFTILVIICLYHHGCYGNPAVKITVRLQERNDRHSPDDSQDRDEDVIVPDINAKPLLGERTQNRRGKLNAPPTLPSLTNQHLPNQRDSDRYQELMQNQQIKRIIQEDGGQDEGEECIQCKLLRQELFEEPPLTEQELRQARLEDIKQTILDKLRMIAPPNVTEMAGPLQQEIPHWLMDSDAAGGQADFVDGDNYEEYSEDYYAESEEITIFAHKVYNCTHRNRPQSPSVCMKLQLKNTIELRDISSVKLYVRYQPVIEDEEEDGRSSQLPVLSIFDNTDPHSKNFLSFKMRSGDEQWMGIDVENTIEQWVVNSMESVELGFMIRCNNCPDLVKELTTHTPFLLFKTNRNPSRTKRNSLQCTENSNRCCLAKFYVSFQEVGYTWIRSPDGYWANFCTGKCAGSYEQPAYQHSRMMQVSGKEKSQSNRRNRSCCSPTRFAPISLLYTSSDGYLHKNNLPNMKVEACGCT